MKTKPIIDLYFTRANEALNKESVEKLKKIFDSDSNIQMIQETASELNKKLKETGAPPITVSFEDAGSYITKESQQKVDEASKKEEELRKELAELRQEIEAQLKSCDTYEEEMKILRIYRIILVGRIEDYTISL